VDYRLFLIVAPFAAVVSATVALFVWRRRTEAAARALLWYLIQVSALLVCNTLELLEVAHEWTLFWASVNHLFYSFIPVAWIAFALIYAGGERFVRSGLFWLVAVVPLISNIIIQTNSYHGLFWEEISFAEVAGYTTFAAEYGPWFWANGLYSYALLVIGSVVIGRAYFGGLRLYRRQSAWMVAGALAPLAFNLAYVFRVLGPMQKDYTSVGFAVAGVCFIVGLFRFRLFEIVPAARASVLDAIEDGLIVLDTRGRIVDMNRAALSLFGIDDSVVGTAYKNVPAIAELFRNRDVSVRASFDAQIGANSDQHHYNVVTKRFERRGEAAGSVIVLHDITDRVRLLSEKTRLVQDLEQALSEIKTLRGIIPICSVCKKVRDGAGYWHQVEAYIADHSQAEFSHGLCEECASAYYSNLSER
jgi:PAS domain-containing protein